MISQYIFNFLQHIDNRRTNSSESSTEMMLTGSTLTSWSTKPFIQ